MMLRSLARCLRSLSGLRSHDAVCSSCGGFPLEVLDTAVSTPFFVAAVDTTVSTLSAI